MNFESIPTPKPAQEEVEDKVQGIVEPNAQGNVEKIEERPENEQIEGNHENTEKDFQGLRDLMNEFGYTSGWQVSQKDAGEVIISNHSSNGYTEVYSDGEKISSVSSNETVNLKEGKALLLIEKGTNSYHGYENFVPSIVVSPTANEEEVAAWVRPLMKHA